MNKLSIATVMVLGLWLLTGCGSGEIQKEKKVRPVKTMVVGGIADIADKGFPGVTKENQESELSFRIDGPIITYNVVEGAKVKKGELIAEIDSRDYKVTVQSTKARYDQAKSEADRYHRLWKKGSVSENDYELKLATFQEAEATWIDAKNALKDTKLFAPYSGFYGPKLVDLGEEVRQKQAVASIVDLSVVEVTTIIPEQLAIQFRNFESYKVRIETYSDVVFSATLKEFEKKSTPEGFPLHLILDHANNPDDESQLKVSAGMSCRVTIKLKKTSSDEKSIIIPITAVFEGDTDENPAVWIIDPETMTVKKQSVVFGDIVGNDAIKIEEGLSAGQQIVIAGVQRLTEGDTVRILESN